MARAVVAGDPGPVEHEDDRQTVEAHVEVGLVEGPAEEGGVHGDHRPQTAHGHAGRRRDLVLLGDAHVEAAVGEPRLERQQPRGPGHGRGERHHLRPPFGLLHEGTGEGVGVGRGRDVGGVEEIAVTAGVFATAVAPVRGGTEGRGSPFTSCSRWTSSSSAGA